MITPRNILTSWALDPGILIPTIASAWLYARGVSRARGVKSWRTSCWFAGLAALFIALISPLHPLSEVLFSAHMVQHELLMLVAAPLLVLSRPLVPMLWGLPFEWRRTAGRWSRLRTVQTGWRAITAPPVAWALHATALWLWHAPAFFQAALFNQWIHAAQHISFFGTALLFWWSLFHGRAASYGAAVLYLFTTAVHTSVLGALLTLSRGVWYPVYQITAGVWNVSALEDQQVGGLIMWVPGGLVYLATAIVLFATWLRASDPMAARRRYAH